MEAMLLLVNVNKYCVTDMRGGEGAHSPTTHPLRSVCKNTGKNAMDRE
jgi:hypothetical protein